MAQVVVEMSGDEAKLFRAYQKIIDQASKLEGKQKDLAKTTQQAGSQAEQSFGATAAAAVGKYAMGMVSLQAATQAFSAAMAHSKANTDAAIASVERLISTRRQLLQVGESSGDVQKMDAFANQLANRGISRDAAQEIIFAARSENFTGSEDEVARLIGANYMSASDARTYAGLVPGIFDYKVSAMQGIAGAAYGAQISRLNAAEYSAMLPKAASAAELAGGTPAEAFALAAILPRKHERGAEYVATMAGQLATGEASKQFAGKGVMGMIDILKGMPEGQRRKLLGTSKESNLAYGWLSGALGEEVRRVTTEAGSAMEDVSGFVSGIESMAFDPNTEQGRIMLGRRRSIVANNQLEASRESRLAEGGFARRSRVIEETQRNEQMGMGPLSRYVSNLVMTQAEEMQLPEWAIGGAARASRLTPLSVLEQAASKLLDAGDSLLRGADATARQRASANQQPE